MAPRKSATADKNASKAPPKRKVAANGFKLPDPVDPGEILTDVAKKRWKLGKSVGTGGFGEIYLASDDVDRVVDEDASYVVKIEPHSNGPLFTEMHCYLRIAKPEYIESWMREKKLKRLGMPKYLGSGSHEYKGQKYRFMVMERFGPDLQKILEQNKKMLSFKTVCQIGIQILDVLEYIHSKEYIHADIKASNLLIGYRRGTEDQVYLVDYGLACRYANNGKHKEYKYDQRKAHDGTIEFTSRDAHIGAHSRRGDMEILGFNMVQWLSGKLPWEENLQDCNYVAMQKRGFMDKVSSFMAICFPDYKPPGIQEYLEYVANLTFDERPDYERCRSILREGLKAKGYKDDGKLVFLSATPRPKKPKSRIPQRKGPAKRRSEEEENLGVEIPQKVLKSASRSPCRPRNMNRVSTRQCSTDIDAKHSISKPSHPEFAADPEEMLIMKENQKMLARKQQQRPKRLFAKKDTSLDNPTPQMLAIMAKKREKSVTPPCQKRHRHNSTCSATRNSPQSEDVPSEFTPEMEAVMRRRAERVSGDGYSSSSSSPSSPPFSDYEGDDSNDATVYYSPVEVISPSPKLPVTRNSRAENKRSKHPGILRELADILIYTSHELNPEPQARRVTRSNSRQTSPELF